MPGHYHTGMHAIDIIEPRSFPEKLRQIPQPPAKLYCRGRLPAWDKKFLAVVGARKYSDYGMAAAKALIEELVGSDIVIVSGLALGIDAIAHRAALEAGLTTVAVPGSGLSERVLYPATNRPLAHTIIEQNGCLLSEFEPDFSATPWSFPQRNRLMAGLSDAVLVIEAEKRSGTLITARLATDYNRTVLAVPGDIWRPGSAGPHLLLRLGATLVESGADILEALGIAGQSAEPARSLTDCGPDELRLLSLLDAPKGRDELLQALGWSAAKLGEIASLLELKGHTEERCGEIIRKCA